MISGAERWPPSQDCSTCLPNNVVSCGNLGLGRVAVVDHHAVAEGERLAFGDRDAAVALGVVVEVVFAKGIDREQPVIARVPISRMLDVGGIIEDGDAERFAIHLAGVIHPVGALAPDVVFSHLAFRVQHLEVGFGESIDDADGKGTLFGVSHFKRHAFIGGQREGAVDDARGGVAAEGVFLGFTADGFAVGAHQFELRLQGSALAVALDLIELAEDGSPLGQFLARVIARRWRSALPWWVGPRPRNRFH